MTHLTLNNRVFIKHPCDQPRGSVVQVNGRLGIVASPTLLQVGGPAHAWVSYSEADVAPLVAKERAWMAQRARRQRLSSAERYVFELDPRFRPDDW